MKSNLDQLSLFNFSPEAVTINKASQIRRHCPKKKPPPI